MPQETPMIEQQQSTNIPSVKVKHTDHHELIAWTDGTVSIQHWQYQLTQDATLGHVQLSLNEARALRNFLNSEIVMQALGLL
jgi:hypothetical protein